MAIPPRSTAPGFPLVFFSGFPRRHSHPAVFVLLPFDPSYPPCAILQSIAYLIHGFQGDIATEGGADGEGGAAPLPCLQRAPLPLQLAVLSVSLDPHPAREGRGQCVGIADGKPCPGRSSEASLFPGYSHAVDRGDIATGGGADGEGACPLPCLYP